jgi:hypothetical protein
MANPITERIHGIVMLRAFAIVLIACVLLASSSAGASNANAATGLGLTQAGDAKVAVAGVVGALRPAPWSPSTAAALPPGRRIVRARNDVVSRTLQRRADYPCPLNDLDG